MVGRNRGTVDSGAMSSSHPTPDLNLPPLPNVGPPAGAPTAGPPATTPSWPLAQEPTNEQLNRAGTAQTDALLDALAHRLAQTQSQAPQNLPVPKPLYTPLPAPVPPVPVKQSAGLGYRTAWLAIIAVMAIATTGIATSFNTLTALVIVWVGIVMVSASVFGFSKGSKSGDD